jgi:hypothetical protein
MQRMEAIRARWESYQPSKTQAFWFAVAAVVGMLIVGFGFAGWVTGGTAQRQTEEAAANARNELAAAVCVTQFMASADAKAQLVKLKDAGWWDRNELVAKAGFATMPDRKEPNPVVASMCATRLSELGQQKS